MPRETEEESPGGRGSGETSVGPVTPWLPIAPPSSSSSFVNDSNHRPNPVTDGFFMPALGRPHSARRADASNPKSLIYSSYSGSREAIKLGKAAWKLHRRCAKLPALRDDSSTLREKVACESTTYQGVIERMSRSQAEFLNELETAMSRMETVYITPTLLQLHWRLKKDHSTMEVQIQKLNAAQRELSAVDGGLKLAEQKADKAAKWLARLVESLELDHAYGKDTGVRSNIEPPEPETLQQAAAARDPLLDDYYSALADLEIMTERLETLKFEYHEALAVRTFQQEHDQVLPVSDEAFESDYQLEFTTAHKDYDEALAATAYAKQVCESKGIDVNKAVFAIQSGPEHLTPLQPSLSVLPDSPPSFDLDHDLSSASKNHPVSSRLAFSETTGPLMSGITAPRLSKEEREQKVADTAYWIQAVPNENIASSSETRPGTEADTVHVHSESYDKQINDEINPLHDVPAIQPKIVDPWPSRHSPTLDEHVLESEWRGSYTPQEQDGALASPETAFGDAAAPAVAGSPGIPTIAEASSQLPITVPTRRRTTDSPDPGSSLQRVQGAFRPNFYTGIFAEPGSTEETTTTQLTRRQSDSALPCRSRHDSGQDDLCLPAARLSPRIFTFPNDLNSGSRFVTGLDCRVGAVEG